MKTVKVKGIFGKLKTKTPANKLLKKVDKEIDGKPIK